jgi:periplasmic divalent cation tolerance protein
MKPVILYMTASSELEARSIGHSLLKERLVACINIIPSIQSLYWWNDEIQDDTETAFYAKTTDDKVEKIITRVGELHSYDTPCVVSMPLENGHPDFLKWVVAETQN